MQPRQPLPLEISTYIIDYLYNCPTSLKSCSHVCQAWLAISRFHLFYCIRLYLSGPGVRVSNRFRRLHDVIEQSPSVALFIRELHIIRSSKMLRMPDSEWPKLGMVIPLLFSKFTRLQKFDVAGINWSHLTADARSSVRALLALPSLVHLAVRFITVSKIQHITALLPPNLKRLTVVCIRVRADDPGVIHAIDVENGQMFSRNSRQLEYLKVYQTPIFNNWLLGEQSDVDISNIHTLDTEDEIAVMLRLVRSMGPSLEHLKISCLSGGSYCFDHQLLPITA
jgi:hypothetical protein